MLRKNSGDVVIDHDYLVDFAVPLLGEHADGGRAAADAHPLFSSAVDCGRLARLDNHDCAFIDCEFHRLAVAQVQQSLAGHRPFPAAAAGQVANAAEREHPRTVFTGGDVAYGLALSTQHIRLRAQVSISIDLHLDPAVAENALRDHGDHIHALHCGGDDEGSGLVVGVGCTCANCGDKGVRTTDDAAI